MSGERAILALADGRIFEGAAWGAPGIATGEVVFTTPLSGYEEVLTDPSYTGQIVTMTAPQIGNTGINPDDVESTSGRPQASGLIVRDLSQTVSSYRSTEALDGWLARHGIVAIADLDTRALTRHLRDHGAQNGAIGVGSAEELIRLARQAPAMEGLDLVGRVSPAAPYSFTEASGEWSTVRASDRPCRHIVAIDLGMKRNILRNFVDLGCKVTVVPAKTSAKEILDLAPDGVFISNGPGDPAAVTYAVDTVRDLLGKKPLFGICLGHQLLALALGGKTYKLRYGHRGANHPVKDLATGKVEITSQNHGFAVDLESLGGKAETTHVHLNDGTSEGLDVPSLGAFSVQYHPEAAAGPHDAHYLFERFLRRIDESCR